MIRSYRPEDAAAVMEIWWQATLSGHDFISTAYWQEQYAVVENQYLPAAESYLYLLGGEPVGFISLLQGNFIGALFVHPGHQGHGIGQALLDHAKALTPLLSLQVYQKNKRAVGFYRKQGFAIIRAITGENPLFDEYVMSWQE